MREFNNFYIKGSNPSHYNFTPNAILADDLVTHLLKYYGHIVLSDKYAVFDNKVLEYGTIKQLSLPGNNFDLSLAEMGLKHTSFYNKLMDYLKDNIYISPDDLQEYSSRSEVSEKMHEIVGKIKQKMEDLIKMNNNDNSLTSFNALEANNEQMLKELGSLLYQYDRLLKNAQSISNMGINGANCGCLPPPPPPIQNNSGNTSSSSSIMSEISNLQSSKLDIEEASKKYATKDSIETVSNNISKSIESAKNDVLRTVGENYQEKVYSGLGIKVYDGNEITVDTKTIATREYVEDQIDSAKIQAAGKEIDLSSYAKKVDVDKKANNSEVEKKLDIDEAASIYATKNELKYKADKIDLDTKLNIDDAKRTYATKNEIPDTSDLVVYEDLDKVKYVLERAINNKVSSDTLSSYALSSDLANKMDKGIAEDIFARKNDLNSKADKVELVSYPTREEMISKINEAKLTGNGQNLDLSIYAIKSEVTKNITSSEEKLKSELYNSLSGKLDKVTAENTYAKQEQIPSITNLASKDELTKAISDASSNYVSKVSYDVEIANVKATQTQLKQEIDNKVIPDISGLASQASVNEKLSKTEAADIYAKKETLNSYATQDYVKDQINQAQISGEGKDIDLTAYALKNDTDKAINDAKEALTVSIDSKIDKSVVESDYAKKTEIPSIDNLVTQEALNTAIQNKADTSSIPDVSKFISEEKIDEKIAAAKLNTGETVDTSSLILKSDYESDKSTFATKEELNAKANSSDIPSIEGLAKSSEIVTKADYEKDKETFALKTALDELTTKYNELLAKVTKLEETSKSNSGSSSSVSEELKTEENEESVDNTVTNNSTINENTEEEQV